MKRRNVKLPSYWKVKDTPYLPLSKRIERFMKALHEGTRLYPYNDPAVIKACIDRGLIKRVRNYFSSHMARNAYVPLVPAPVVEAPRVAVPYAKRKADLDAAGLRRIKS